jgi:hypothetical protein
MEKNPIITHKRLTKAKNKKKVKKEKKWKQQLSNMD